VQTQKRKELRVRNKCTCHVYGQIHQYKIQIETEEIKLDAQSSKTKLQKIQRWQRVEKQKTLKLKTQVFQLKQPHKKPGFPLTIGRIEHGTLEHPSARRAPYYPICYTCSWHSPPLLVSVATSCLNREGLEPKGLRMQWSTLGGFMQDLSLLVIDEGQQYGTDREIAVISLLKQQPLVLWTGDSQQTPGGIAQAAPNAKRSRQLLLAIQPSRSNDHSKQHRTSKR
jgi:hypothetical protein